MKIKNLILMAAAGAFLLTLPTAKAQNGAPAYTSASISFSGIWNANIGQFQSTNAFTGSTNYPVGVGPKIGNMKYQNIALEDVMTPPTNSAGCTNTYTFARSIDGTYFDLNPSDEYVWVHVCTQSAGIVQTNSVATTNINIGAYGYLELVNYAVTTGTNQSQLFYSQKISCP